MENISIVRYNMGKGRRRKNIRSGWKQNELNIVIDCPRQTFDDEDDGYQNDDEWDENCEDLQAHGL